MFSSDPFSYMNERIDEQEERLNKRRAVTCVDINPPDDEADPDSWCEQCGEHFYSEDVSEDMARLMTEQDDCPSCRVRDLLSQMTEQELFEVQWHLKQIKEEQK